MSEPVEASEPNFWGDVNEDEVLQRFRTLVNTVDDGIYQLDMEGRFVAVNDVIVEMTGYPREDLIGEHASLLLEDDDVERIAEEIARRLSTGEPQTELFEFTVQTADGKAIVCELQSSLLLDDGTLQGTVGIVRDITEQKEMERELERQRDRLASELDEIYERITDGVFGLNDQWEFTHLNDRAERILGYDEEELRGTTIWEPFPDIVDTTFEDHYREAMASQEPVSFEAYYPPDDTWYEEHVYPSETGLSIYFRDVTEQRRREQEHQQVVRALEAAEEGISLLDENGEFIYVNDAYADTFGYEPGEMIGEHWDDLGIEDDPEYVYDEVLPTIEQDGQWTGTTTCVRSDESTFLAQHSLTQATDDELICVVRDVTEQRQLEHELEEIFGRITDAFYALDDQWRFTHVNERAEELIDVTGEGLVGKHIWKTFEWAADSKLREEYEQAMETQESTSFEFYYPEPLDAWYEVNAYPSETGLSVYFRDITERKERERELAETLTELLESEERLRLALEAGEMGMWELDLRTRDSPVRSLQHDRIFGYEEPTDDWSLEIFLDHVHPDDREMVRQSFEEALETGSWEFECRIIRTDGEQRVIAAQGEFYYDDGGEPRRAVGLVQDITERKRHERKLAESEQRYRTLAECFPNGIVTLFDDKLRYTLAAGRAFDNLSVTSEDVEGQRPREVWGDDIADVLEPALTTALDGEEQSIEVEYEGREWVIHAVPVTDDEGEVFAGMTMAQDITERKRREQQLEASNERLEQFAYAASHDLQEPLRMVSSYLQLIERRYGDKLDEDGREFLEFAVDGADRMREMIEALLQYSRVETCGEPLEPVELEAIFNEACEDLHMKIQETDAEITVEDLPQIVGDGNQLRQVFQNLLDNAIEYSGDNPPRVHVGTERRNDKWVISVADEGIGIDPNEQDRVFEVFQSLHSQGEYSGTGIGLALCERIIERHDGDIWVESEPGEGATFSLTLPAIDDSNE